jgi:hypothetical protein
LKQIRQLGKEAGKDAAETRLPPAAFAAFCIASSLIGISPLESNIETASRSLLAVRTPLLLTPVEAIAI